MVENFIILSKLLKRVFCFCLKLCGEVFMKFFNNFCWNFPLCPPSHIFVNARCWTVAYFLLLVCWQFKDAFSCLFFGHLFMSKCFKVKNFSITTSRFLIDQLIVFQNNAYFSLGPFLTKTRNDNRFIWQWGLRRWYALPFFYVKASGLHFKKYYRHWP